MLHPPHERAARASFLPIGFELCLFAPVYGVPDIAFAAPLFFLFEIGHLVASEKYLGVKQIQRGTDPRYLPPARPSQLAVEATPGHTRSPAHRRQPLHALLMMLIFILLAPQLMLYDIIIPYNVEAAFILLLSVMAATVAALTIIIHQWALGAALALGASLLANLVHTLLGTFAVESTGPASGGLIISSGVFLASSLLSVLILYGPWMFWNVVDSARRKPA